ncbi:MAG: helix-turn-helix transcriptional regulator [Oscillospiraceae bacterium]|nr:helix-turn-helix transcriptional regulator [Oscillospiraceae bacterium]
MGRSFATSTRGGETLVIMTDHELREDVERYFSQEFPLAVCVQNFRHATEDYIPYHWHKELQMTWVRKGELAYNVNGEQFVLGRGELLFVRDHCLHSSKTVAGDVETLCLNFAPEIFHPAILKNYVLPLLEDERFSYALLPVDEARLVALGRIGALERESLAYFSACNFLSDCFEEILRRFEIAAAAGDREELQLFQTMIDFAHSHCAQPLTVRQIAASAGLGKNRCTALFQKYAAQPPAKYLAQYRLHLARGMLLGSDRTVSEISADVGYNQVSHFIEQFRLRYGLSPLQYRRKYGEK